MSSASRITRAQQQKRINTRFRWFISSQSFAMIQAETVATLSSLHSLLSAMVASLPTRLPVSLPVGRAQAAPGVTTFFESPEEGQVVSGVAIIRGWIVSDGIDASVSKVFLVIDGQPGGTAPCCSGRADVAAAFPDNLNALNSGWGAVFNYGLLTPGPHTLGMRTGGYGSAYFHNHTVTVVKPGGFEFLDQVDLSGATAQVARIPLWGIANSNKEIRIEGVRVRDKATRQEEIITVHLRWFQHSQALGIVSSSE
jgi:hypothetical protein